MMDEQIAQKGLSPTQEGKLALGPALLARVEAGEAEPNPTWQSCSMSTTGAPLLPYMMRASRRRPRFRGPPARPPHPRFLNRQVCSGSTVSAGPIPGPRVGWMTSSVQIPALLVMLDEMGGVKSIRMYVPLACTLAHWYIGTRQPGQCAEMRWMVIGGDMEPQDSWAK